MSNTIEQIYAAVQSQLGSEYRVLCSYDATEQLDPSGSIAINVAEMEHLDHAGCEDYRFGVTVSGYTLADEDKTRSKIYAMEAYVLKCIDLDALKSSIDCLAGGVMGEMTTQSDGDSNEFTLNFDLYVAPATFEDSSSAIDGSSNSSGD